MAQDAANRTTDIADAAIAYLNRPHLARQTHGDASLQREVLHLFAVQVETLVASLDDPKTDLVYVAHTLMGSAQGVGAEALVKAALAVERRAVAGGYDPALIRKLKDVAASTLVDVRLLLA